MAVRLFEGKEHASSYYRYRPAPSEELVNNILEFVRSNRGLPFDLAVDVGCGSGQGTQLLAPHFTKVVGTDISPAQLEQARTHAAGPGISYRECPAEELPFADGSVDLVTVMSAFHWFDRGRFLLEAGRVLKPRGCLALLNYSMDLELSSGTCTDALNQVCKEFYAALLPYRNPHLAPNSLAFYKQAYTDLPYPVKEWRESFWSRRPVTLSGYMGLIESFSSYQALLQEDPEKARRLSQDIMHRLLRVLGETSLETEVVLGINYFYLLASKPSEG